jgi:hypothetical protein
MQVRCGGSLGPRFGRPDRDRERGFPRVATRSVDRLTDHPLRNRSLQCRSHALDLALLPLLGGWAWAGRQAASRKPQQEARPCVGSQPAYCLLPTASPAFCFHCLLFFSFFLGGCLASDNGVQRPASC